METLASKFGFIAVDASSRAIFHTLERYADSSATILIQGETGVGKEVAAQALHKMGKRAAQPFIPINCGALPDTLVESELFGHEKGAFTGATHTKLGAFERAHNGTLFLDEIGELSLFSQQKLLRVLESFEVQRVGGEQTRQVNVRVVCATNREIDERDKFREDLYYRIEALQIRIPPLRQRPGDLLVISDAFLRRFAPETGPKKLSTEATKKLCGYHWPGNIRQLRNVLYRAAFNSPETEIKAEAIVFKVKAPCAEESSAPLHVVPPPDRGTLQSVERATIEAELERNGWNRNQTSRSLGIALSTVKAKIKKFNLIDPKKR